MDVDIGYLAIPFALLTMSKLAPSFFDMFKTKKNAKTTKGGKSSLSLSGGGGSSSSSANNKNGHIHSLNGGDGTCFLCKAGFGSHEG